MNTELKKNLTVAYITLIAMAFIAAVLIQLQHQLTLWIALELAGLVIVFSLAWTWWQVHDARQMSRRLRIVREHLEAFDLEVVPLSSEQFNIVDHHIVLDIREPHGIYVAERLDISELEIFADGVETGWRISTYDEQEDEDNPLTVVGTMIPDTLPETTEIGLQLIDGGNEWVYSGG